MLCAAEAATIKARVAAYNNIIRTVANEKGAALVDVNALFTQRGAPAACRSAASTLHPRFLTGGLFAYDGVHPTAFGYAYIANLFIDAINAKYGGDIPLVNLYPFVFGTSSAASSLFAGASLDIMDSGRLRPADPGGHPQPVLGAQRQRHEEADEARPPRPLIRHPPASRSFRARRGGG